MTGTDSNVLLVLMRLDLNQQYPLRGSEIDSTGYWKKLQEDKEDEQYLLLAGVLDPAERAAAAPVTPIH